VDPMTAIALQGLFLGLFAVALVSPMATAGAAVPDAISTNPAPQPSTIRARFQTETPSSAARRVADWVVATQDNQGLPFLIVDKLNAKVFVFSDDGLLRGAAPALLGLARGDDSVPGIGHRKLATIGVSERTTPAGRFVAALGHDFEQGVLWIDYDAALSLHRVIIGDPGDHRLRRLASASPLDRRISYGCINVPVKFYDTVVAPTFSGTSGVVYILPEIKAISAVFDIQTSEARPPRAGLGQASSSPVAAVPAGGN
jgi:hypothetical protein